MAPYYALGVRSHGSRCIRELPLSTGIHAFVFIKQDMPMKSGYLLIHQFHTTCVVMKQLTMAEKQFNMMVIPYARLE